MSNINNELLVYLFMINESTKDLYQCIPQINTIDMHLFFLFGFFIKIIKNFCYAEQQEKKTIILPAWPVGSACHPRASVYMCK